MLRNALVVLGLFFAGTVAAVPPEAGEGMHDLSATDHVKVSSVGYRIPPVHLVRENGRSVSLPAELDDGRPVVLNFIYTTCETTCPLSSATFAQLQRLLRADHSNAHLVSVSIDPEQDTPPRLRAYAKKFSAQPNWQFYTGTLQASATVQQAFGVYRGDKMSHTPVTLLRRAPGEPWTRVDGFATPEQLLHYYNDLHTP